MKARWVIAGVVGVGLAGAGVGKLAWKAKDGPRYRTARVERGDLVQTVRATGIVQPIRLVQAGTQVNGPVQKLYVDFNDLVKEGDLVAQIDPTVYEARLAQDQANLAQSLAAVEQAKARLTQADKDLERARSLAGRDMVSQTELDAAVANRDALAAQVRVADAAVEQARAALRLSKANLDYTTIRSPVNGVVIARNVSEGQTVVASMSAQVLFLIATDLREIQVEASIPEADIGKLRADHPVIFSVDAFDQAFTGTVAQVRLAASTVQNVVTYPVVVRAANPERRLFPGMTANLVFEVARRTAALKVPNAALRFKPEEPAEGKGPAPGRTEGRRHAGPAVWVPAASGAPPRPVPVSVGINDGSFTEICEPCELAESADIILGLEVAKAKEGSVVNPFAPPTLHGARRGSPR